MNERRKIAANGHISVAVALGRNGQITGKPAIRMQGVPVEEERNAFLDEASDAAQEAVSDRFTDLANLREKVRLAARGTAPPWTGKTPVAAVLQNTQSDG